jgi:hypothetical protein
MLLLIVANGGAPLPGASSVICHILEFPIPWLGVAEPGYDNACARSGVALVENVAVFHSGTTTPLLSVLLAHNLGRELRMIAHPPSRATVEKRPAFWVFERLDTFRRRVIRRVGRLIRPQGQLTLSMSANPAVQAELLHYLEALQAA